MKIDRRYCSGTQYLLQLKLTVAHSCVLQVPAASHYSMVFYFVASNAPQQGSLLQRFVDGDDNFRNSRLKLIPLVPKVIHCPHQKSFSWK
jgi:hypothetical protein